LQLLPEERRALKLFRKNKGLRLGDLADENLSPSSISNVEKGNHVRKDTLEAYFSKLESFGLKRDSILDLIKKEKKMSEQSKLKFMLLESKIDLDLLSKVMSEIRELENKSEVPKEFVFYLRAKYYQKKTKWSQAKIYFEKVVDSCTKQNNTSSNLIAS
jgi:transcriptional regulator with XRE-family HTH domain